MTWESNCKYAGNMCIFYMFFSLLYSNLYVNMKIGVCEQALCIHTFIHTFIRQTGNGIIMAVTDGELRLPIRRKHENPISINQNRDSTLMKFLHAGRRRQQRRHAHEHMNTHTLN